MLAFSFSFSFLNFTSFCSFDTGGGGGGISEFLLLISFTFTSQPSFAESPNSRKGVGIGHAFGGLGFRYDYKFNDETFFSANIGLGGVNAGIRYSLVQFNQLSSLIASVYRGSNIVSDDNSQDISYISDGLSDMFDHKDWSFEESFSIGIDYQYTINATWSMEVGGHYLMFRDSIIADRGDGVRLSIGFNYYH